MKLAENKVLELATNDFSELTKQEAECVDGGFMASLEEEYLYALINTRRY